MPVISSITQQKCPLESGHETQDLLRDCFGTSCLAMTSSAIFAFFYRSDYRRAFTERPCCWERPSHYAKEPLP
jgi:hypothetical protein